MLASKKNLKEPLTCYAINRGTSKTILTMQKLADSQGLAPTFNLHLQRIKYTAHKGAWYTHIKRHEFNIYSVCAQLQSVQKLKLISVQRNLLKGFILNNLFVQFITW